MVVARHSVTSMPGPVTPPGAEDPFLTACRGGFSGRTPVWFMRQAGRSLPEYRALRGGGSILSAVRQPDVVVEVTLQPVRRYGVDAAILFSDIVVPVAAVGFGVDVRPGVGPVVERPFSGSEDLSRLRPLEAAEDIPYVAEAVTLLVKELPVPLIGFAGAPFTVASYLIEGGPSRDYARTKSLMYRDPVTWSSLLDALADMAATALRAQVTAGAAAVQVFDSWAGALSPSDYRRHVLPASRRLFGAIADLGVPRIHFGVGTGELLGLLAEAGADVVGVDWRVPIGQARQRVGPGVAVQGNLDPAAVVAGMDVARDKTREVLQSAGAREGHVFNLGHGVLPQSDPGVLAGVVDLVHQETASR
jgi:uroporphyrinogen decarboxylase